MEQHSVNENQVFDLTPLAKKWFTDQFDAFVNNNQETLDYIKFDVRAFVHFVIHYVLTYQRQRQWGNITNKTSKIVNYSDRQIRNEQKCGI